MQDTPSKILLNWNELGIERLEHLVGDPIDWEMDPAINLPETFDSSAADSVQGDISNIEKEAFNTEEAFSEAAVWIASKKANPSSSCWPRKGPIQVTHL